MNRSPTTGALDAPGGRPPTEDLSKAATAAQDLRGVFPEHALSDFLDSRPTTKHAAHELLRDANAAYATGRRTVGVPTVLTGGRLGFKAPAGLVRDVLAKRLTELVRTGRLRRGDAAALVARYGLEGQPGSAGQARHLIGRGRQATSDAVNRALEAVAADLCLHPLTPVSAPRLDCARRQEIVGAVLSLLSGPPQQFPERLYAHMRVRSKLLGDPRFPVVGNGATQRQRRHRLASRWQAIACDHLERDRLPWHMMPRASAAERSELDDWLASGHPDLRTPSVGAVRALVVGGESAAFSAVNDVRGVLGLLLDGYRPMIELVRLAHWAHDGSELIPWASLDPATAIHLRTAAILSVAELLAVRGYPDAALTYTGIAQRLVDERGDAWLRFRRLLICEAASYLRGAASIAQTREWHAALVRHLNDHGSSESADPLAVAHAIMKTEHAAWTAGVASGATVQELLAPLGDSLTEALGQVGQENRERFQISRDSLSRTLSGEHSSATPQPLTAPPGDVGKRLTRYDEWYCAYPVAVARWDYRGRGRGSDDWRR